MNQTQHKHHQKHNLKNRRHLYGTKDKLFETEYVLKIGLLRRKFP